jgi:hypothetical protein
VHRLVTSQRTSRLQNNKPLVVALVFGSGLLGCEQGEVELVVDVTGHPSRVSAS